MLVVWETVEVLMSSIGMHVSFLAAFTQLLIIYSF